jgi:hypothetical protein
MKKNGKVGIATIYAAASNSPPNGSGLEQRAPGENTRMDGVIAGANGATDSDSPRQGMRSSKRLVATLEEENLQLRDQVLGLALEIFDLKSNLRPGERTRWDDIGRH